MNLQLILQDSNTLQRRRLQITACGDREIGDENAEIQKTELTMLTKSTACQKNMKSIAGIENFQNKKKRANLNIESSPHRETSDFRKNVNFRI
jgi:hypothetical protein